MIKLKRKLISENEWQVYANGILIVTLQKRLNWYSPSSSRLRYNTRQRNEYSISWEITGLSQLFKIPITAGSSNYPHDFYNDWHNTRQTSLKYIKSELYRVAKRKGVTI